VAPCFIVTFTTSKPRTYKNLQPPRGRLTSPQQAGEESGSCLGVSQSRGCDAVEPSLKRTVALQPQQGHDLYDHITTFTSNICNWAVPQRRSGWYKPSLPLTSGPTTGRTRTCWVGLWGRSQAGLRRVTPNAQTGTRHNSMNKYYKRSVCVCQNVPAFDLFCFFCLLWPLRFRPTSSPYIYLPQVVHGRLERDPCIKDPISIPIN